MPCCYVCAGQADRQVQPWPKHGSSLLARCPVPGIPYILALGQSGSVCHAVCLLLVLLLVLPAPFSQSVSPSSVK